MKCPKCDQNIMGNPEMCINCGHTLKPHSSPGLSKKSFLIIAASFIAVGIMIIFGIIFVGRDKELASFIENKEKGDDTSKIDTGDKADYKIENFDVIKSHFGNYIISSVITSSASPSEISDNKKNYIGWPIDFFEDSIKISIYKRDWLILNDLKLYINNDANNLYKPFTGISNIQVDFAIEGKSTTLIDDVHKYNFLIANDQLYLYTYNTLFGLKKVADPPAKNDNFYKITLSNEIFTNNDINQKIDAFKNEFNNLVEGNSSFIEPGSYVIEFNYEKIQDENIIFILLTKGISEPLGHSYMDFQTIAYNIITNDTVGLLQYLETKNIDKHEIENKYLGELEKSNFQLEYTPLSNDSTYYVSGGILHIMVEGYKIEIKL